MKKVITIIFIILFQISAISAGSSNEIQRIMVGNKEAKITIIVYESLTCSHCADFHINIFPDLKKEYVDTGIAKVEFRHFPLDIAAFNASKIAQCKNDGSSDILNSLYLNHGRSIKTRKRKNLRF